MSPVAMWGSPSSAARRGAWVPLPAPGGPKISRFLLTARTLAGARREQRQLLQEALVVAHHHLRLHLAHGVERHADDDQHRRAAERAGGGLREPGVADEDRRQH